MIPLFHHLLAALLLLPLAAHGTIVTTTTDEDDGSLVGGSGISLREAVKYSSGTITFAPALSGRTIRLTLGEILISQSLTIDGSALPEKITLSGDKTGDGPTADDTRILRITAGTVLLQSLNLTRGYAQTASPSFGAGIYVDSTSAKVTIRHSSFIANSAADGAAIYYFGRLNSPNSLLTIENSTFSQNAATGEAGAIRSFGSLIVDRSTFIGNTARLGGAIYCRDGTVQISNSTLAINSAKVYGGGIYNAGPSISLQNSTLTGNSSGDDGGGIYSLRGNLVILHATVTKNSALSSRGGIHCASTSALSLNKSMVAGNTAPFAPDLPSTFTGTNNLTSGDPRLASLNYYGGPTQTMPPLPGSPAIDAGGKDKGSPSLPTDQRGFDRFGPPDTGAVEYPAELDVTRIASEWNTDFDSDASPYGTEQALGTDPLVSDPASSRNITAPVLNASGHPVLRFGIGAAAPGTRWILCRSTDLLTFTEIYRYNGTSDTAALGVTFLRTATGVTVTDTTPPPGGVFYRFEAQFGN